MSRQKKQRRLHCFVLGDWVALGAINVNSKRGKDSKVTVKYNVEMVYL